jgi:L-ascorbate metabolism protein UlaG (beta-lactamase superfamily)
MKVKWLGHSSFLITSEKGTKIITDPYATNEKLRYGEIKESADIVTVSHDHFDHGNVSAIGGKPQIYRGPAPAEIKGVKFHSVQVFHDTNQGKDRGKNVIVCMEVDGVKLCHLGDLGHQLSDSEAAQIGSVDVLFSPVGGFYTITADVATEVVNKIKPKAVIPMHFKNERNDFPIAGVEDFVKGKKNVSKKDSSEIEFKADKLPAQTQIIVLKPAL